MKITHCTPQPVLVLCGLENFDYQIDPYIGCTHGCRYCYVLSIAETDWTREIQIHHDIVGQLADELASLAPQTIYMGYHTDPYQPCEAEYRQTRKVLQLLLDRGFSASILTKSDLVLRDLDLLEKMVAASVSVSVAFSDDCRREQFEVNTMATAARIEALKKLKAAGVGTGALVCPVIPYLTEVEPLIDRLTPHADTIRVYGLSILNRSDPSWQNVSHILEICFPEKKGRIESALFSKGHPYWANLRQELEDLKQERGLPLLIHV